MNGCLEKESTLKNQLWDVLLRSRFHPVNLCADNEKASLEIHIQESERYCLRFNWFGATNNNKFETYYFVRLVFGLTQTLFISQANLYALFDNYEQEFQEIVEKVRDHMFGDNLIAVGESISEVKKLKSNFIGLFWQEGSLRYISGNKWHSN